MIVGRHPFRNHQPIEHSDIDNRKICSKAHVQLHWLSNRVIINSSTEENVGPTQIIIKKWKLFLILGKVEGISFIHFLFYLIRPLEIFPIIHNQRHD